MSHLTTTTPQAPAHFLSPKLPDLSSPMSWYKPPQHSEHSPKKSGSTSFYQARNLQHMDVEKKHKKAHRTHRATPKSEEPKHDFIANMRASHKFGSIPHSSSRGSSPAIDSLDPLDSVREEPVGRASLRAPDFPSLLNRSSPTSRRGSFSTFTNRRMSMMGRRDSTMFLQKSAQKPQKALPSGLALMNNSFTFDAMTKGTAELPPDGDEEGSVGFGKSTIPPWLSKRDDYGRFEEALFRHVNTRI
jgi:hypothetical protein